MIAAARVGVLLAAALCLTGSAARASHIEDPQALLARIQNALVVGNIEKASSAAARLRALVKADPQWDPDGRIGTTQLPALEKRIAALRSSSSAVNLLLQRASRRLEGARAVDDETELILFLRAEKEAAAQAVAELEKITGAVAPGADRGALMQGDLYLRALRAALTRSLPEVSEDFGSCVEGDGRQTALLTTRLEALKREVMFLSQELAAARSSRLDEQKLLIEFIGQTPSGLSSADRAGLNELGTALAHRLRQRLDAVRALKSQTPLERMLSLEEMERLRLVNAISVAGGSRDLSGRLDALAAALEAVPLIEKGTERTR